MKILQINVTYKQGSTGYIVHNIHSELLKEGYDSLSSYGRGKKVKGDSGVSRHSNLFSSFIDLSISRMFGLIGYASILPTRKLLKLIQTKAPDIIHLHNIHGYHLNFQLLFTFLKKFDKPVVITLHDEFLYTGKCAYALDCSKFKSSCQNCPQLREYPKTWFFDFSTRMHKNKINLINSIGDLTLVVPSEWSLTRLKSSLLRSTNSQVILNGVNKGIFKYIEGIPSGLREFNYFSHFFISVINDFDDPRKGFSWLLRIAKGLVKSNAGIIVVGEGRIPNNVPSNMIFLGRINDPNNLAHLYSYSEALIMLSSVETFGMVCLEAASCGTKTIGFDAGGVKEAASENSVLFDYGDERIISFLDSVEPTINKKDINVIVDGSEVNQTMEQNYLRLYKEIFYAQQS
jgi:glycosyltransferase involved in cell wall biosynthesis